MIEETFEGSPLRTEIRNAKPDHKILQMTIDAFENNPESKFWKEASEMVMNKLKKYGVSNQ